MSQKQAKRAAPSAILIVQEEELFSGFLQAFPAGKYALLYAAGAAEAMALCETRPPKLIILPGGAAMAGLTEALREVSRQKAALLAVVKDREPRDDPPAGIDREVPADDLEATIEAAADLLKERREKPRVLVEIPILIDGDGEGVARDLSANFMQIHTREPLVSGQPVTVEIGWGDEPFEFKAKVFKADTSVLGATVAMLEIDKNPKTQAYLDNLVKRILEVEHFLQGSSKAAPLRGPMAWKLARRSEEAMREVQRGSQVQVPSEADKPAEPPKTALRSRYHLLDKLGEWGIGTVHNATHQLLNRPVCVKVLHKELHKNKAARKRMEQEARIASSLVSNQVVDVLDFGEDGEGGLYYAMEALEGHTLAELVAADEMLTAVEVVTIGVDVARALSRAHSQNLGHHDLCPANIFLATAPDGERNSKLINFAGELDLDATEPPVVQGAAYRPPEASSVPPGPAYDVYALGATLWDVLGAAGSDVVTPVVKPGSLKDGEKRLREVLQQARAPARKDRFLSMSAFEDALQACLGILKDQRSGSRSRIASTILPRADAKEEDEEEEFIPLDEITIPWPAAKLREIADRGVSEREMKAIEDDVPAPPRPGARPDVSESLARLRPHERKKTPDGQAQPRPRPQSLNAPPDKGTLLGVPSPRPPAPLKPKAPAPPPGAPPKPPKPAPTADVEEPLSEGSRAEADDTTITSPLAIIDDGSAPAPASAEESFDPSQPLLEASEAPEVSEDAPSTLQASPTPEPLKKGGRGKKVVLILVVLILLGAAGAAAYLYRPWEYFDSQSGGEKTKTATGPRPRPMDVTPRPTPTDAGVARRRAAPDATAAQDAAARPATTDAAARPSATDAAAGSQDADVDDPGLTPKQKRNRLMRIAYTLIRRGRYAESRRYLTRALRIDDSSRLRRYFSLSYEKVGKNWPAIYHMKKAVKFSPKNARQHAKLGLLYLKVGQYGNACQSFRRALRYKPRYRLPKRQLEKHCGTK